MTKVSNEKVLKIARLSGIALRNDEINRMAKELEEVVTYARRVSDISADAVVLAYKNTNIFREDVSVSGDAEAILFQAPENSEHFFVVPAALDVSE